MDLDNIKAPIFALYAVMIQLKDLVEKGREVFLVIKRGKHFYTIFS